MNTRPILFVCLGNICRSPLGEGIFRDLAEKTGNGGLYPVDSAGTGAWHAGSPPDPRSVRIAAAHGIDISAQRARKIEQDDFERFAIILAMDRSNLRDLRRMASPGVLTKVHLFNSYATGQEIDVPDPYYGGQKGFEIVYNMLFAGCTSLIEKLTAERTS